MLFDYLDNMKKQIPLPKKQVGAVKQKTVLAKAAPAAKSAPKQATPVVRHTMEKVARMIKKAAVTRKVENRSSVGAPRTSVTTSVNDMAAANEVQKQKEAFEKANKLFHARSFGDAMKLFQQATQGPSIEIGHVAKLHIKMCEQRLQVVLYLQVATLDFHRSFRYRICSLHQGDVR